MKEENYIYFLKKFKFFYNLMNSLDETTVFKLNIYFIVYMKEYVYIYIYIYDIKMPHIFLAFQKKKKRKNLCRTKQEKLIKPIDPKFRANRSGISVRNWPKALFRPKKKKHRKSRWHCGTH